MAAETLSTYLVSTRRLLHDLSANYVPDPTSKTNAQYFSDFDLTFDINKGINARDMWSGGSRNYQSNIPLTIGQDLYTFAALFPALATAGQTVLDIITAWVIYGASRVELKNPAFSTLTEKARGLLNYQNRPWGFSRYGAAQVYIAPAPGAAYTADFDLAVLSTTLVALADADPLPFPYTEPVPFYAAYRAKINQRRFDEAEVFYGYYVRALRDIEGSRVGQLPDAQTAWGHGTRS